MNELASKLFRTFFRSKKSFLRKKLALVKVISKMNFFLSKSEGNSWFGVQNLQVLVKSPQTQTDPKLAAEKVFSQKCAQFADHLGTSAGLYTWFYSTKIHFQQPEIRIFNFFDGRYDFDHFFPPKWLSMTPFSGGKSDQNHIFHRKN